MKVTIIQIENGNWMIYYHGTERPVIYRQFEDHQEATNYATNNGWDAS